MNKKPSEIANELFELKNTLGSVIKAAEKMDMSKTQAYRYLKLLTLKKNELKKVDEGVLSIEQRSIITNAKRANNTDESVLFDILVRIRFSTFDQLVKYSKINNDKTRLLLGILLRKKLIRKDTEYSPYIYSLSNKGCVIADLHKLKHFVSGAAIHQTIMRNKIELEMQEKNATIKFVTRAGWWQRGIYPSIGEHGIEYLNNKKKGSALIIIDDYSMNPARVPHSLTRKHDVDKTYVKGELVMSWIDVIDDLVIYATTESQKKKHQQYYIKNKAIFEVKPIIRYVQPIWGAV